MKNYSKLGQFNSIGRLVKETASKYRSPFQRDRDRIIHSASFRRLKHKTQVFVNTDGDHYRTRITHSIEVAQIARSIANYLRLNDDLTETLSLAHDLGHTPFGHAGEDALNECMINSGGFDHNIQTLRIVMFLEKKYFHCKGLNLSIETLDGLIKHNGPIFNTQKIDELIGLKNLKNKILFKQNLSLEGQIASISDDIAYNNHDIQDGLKAKIFNLKELLEINFFKEIHKEFKNKTKINKEILIYQIIRNSIDLMVKDIIINTINNLKKYKIKNKTDIKKSIIRFVNFSKKFQIYDNEIKEFLKEKMYKNKKVLIKNDKGKKMVKFLFKKIQSKPKKYIKKITNKDRDISDYISGMTDRFAINLYNSLR